MPVEMKCPKCGFFGPHGFHGVVQGIWSYYHNAPGQDKPDHFFYTTSVNKEWYLDKKEAWKVERKYQERAGANKNWLKAWDARILKSDEKGYEKYIELWMKDEEKLLGIQSAY